MAIALEGAADAGVLVLIAVTLLLLACVVVIRGMVGVITQGIRSLSVAGIHFGAPLANAIDGVMDHVVGWVQHWLSVEIHWLVVLFDGLTWSITETINGIVAAYGEVARAFDFTFTHAIPHAISTLRNQLTAAIGTVETFAHAVRTELRRDVGRIEGEVTSLAHRVPQLIRAAIHAFEVAVVRPIAHGLHDLERFVTHEVVPRLGRAESAIGTLYAQIATGVGTIEGVLPHLPHISFDDLEKLWQRVPWRTLGGMLSLGFLTHALLRALTREAGLDSAECRGKVKGICGTHLGAWENLLTGLIGGLALVDLRELHNICQGLVRELESDFRDYAGGGK
jgi:hypothetical protein